MFSEKSTGRKKILQRTNGMQQIASDPKLFWTNACHPDIVMELTLFSKPCTHIPTVYPRPIKVSKL